MRVDRQGAPRQGHPARRLRVPEVAGQRRPHAEGDDPLADDAALPRRPRRHQPRALSRPRAVLRRTSPTAYGDELRSLAAAGCTLRADGRHQPRLPVRRRRCARRRARAATTRTSCRTATRRSSTASSRRSPQGMTLAVHLCRGNFKSTLGGAGRLRAGRRGAAQGDGRRRATSSNTTTRARATSGRCASCPRARPSCSAWSPPSSAQLEVEGRRSSAASTRPRSTCRSSSSRLSPQCGFSSTVHGNDIAVEAQRAKLRLVVEVAARGLGRALTRPATRACRAPPANTPR